VTIFGVKYVRFNHTVIGRREEQVLWACTKLEKERHGGRFDFDNVRGERRGSWDEVAELISRTSLLSTLYRTRLTQGWVNGSAVIDNNTVML